MGLLSKFNMLENCLAIVHEAAKSPSRATPFYSLHGGFGKRARSAISFRSTGHRDQRPVTPAHRYIRGVLQIRFCASRRDAQLESICTSCAQSIDQLYSRLDRPTV